MIIIITIIILILIFIIDAFLLPFRIQEKIANFIFRILKIIILINISTQSCIGLRHKNLYVII